MSVSNSYTCLLEQLKWCKTIVGLEWDVKQTSGYDKSNFKTRTSKLVAVYNQTAELVEVGQSTNGTFNCFCSAFDSGRWVTLTEVRVAFVWCIMYVWAVNLVVHCP